VRKKFSLNGVWNCEPLAWTIVQSNGEIMELDKPLPEIETMEIPCNWHLGGLPNFFGKVKFVKSFQYQLTPEKKGYLCFNGVDYNCSVKLNGNFVGSHTGYFQKFEFDATNYLVNGENLLEVVVESPNEDPNEVWPHNKRLLKGILSHWDARPGGWDKEFGQDGNTGGIWGDLYIEERSSLFIEQVNVHTQILPKKTPDEAYVTHWEDKSSLEANQKAYVWSNINLNEQINQNNNIQIELSLTDENGVRHSKSFLLSSGNKHQGLLVIDQPELWWTWDLGHPHLYNVNVILRCGETKLDEISFKTGIREVTFDAENGLWHINGKRIFIRGTNVIPTLWLGDYNNNYIERDIKLLQDAHINGVRVCVHINRREWYEACDRAGIIIWQDFALQWGYANENNIIEEAVRQIKEMVHDLYNHPSVGIWCCQNESLFFNNEIVGPQLARAAREEDTSRYVHMTSEFKEHPYAGWYYGHWEQYSSTPGGSLITEFGAQALPSVDEVIEMNGDVSWPPNWERLGYHNFQFDQTFYVAKIETGENWETFVRNSQDYQSKLLKRAIESYRKSRFNKVGSLFQFMFMDAWPSITWSVLSYSRKPKKGYYTLQQVYQPILIGTEIRDYWPSKKQFGGGDDNIAFTPWIVNDLHQTFKGAKILITLESKESSFIKELCNYEFEILPDSFQYLEVVRFKHVDSFDNGVYQLVLNVIYGDNTLSTNLYDITIN
jgi:beta-mannosidase